MADRGDRLRTLAGELMLFIVALLMGLVGAVGIVLSLFFTNRKLTAHYGYGGQKAMAQAEQDGITPKLPQLISRVCITLLVAGIVLFIVAMYRS
jgi:hypothetical protein